MIRPHGLLECPCCLKAACILAVTIAVLGGVLLWWLPQAIAAPGVTLQACARSTCAALDAGTQAALAHAGTVIVQADAVRSIAAIPECANCAKVSDEKGHGFLVQGSPTDVACKVFGGTACKSY